MTNDEIWQPPTTQNPYLFLPLTDGNPLKLESNWKQSNTFKCPVTNSWLQCWDAPEIHSDEQLCNTLLILLRPLAELSKGAQESISIHQKDAHFDLVTDADIGIELLIRKWFNMHLPEHVLIGEETPKSKLTATTPTWYLDPIDGTANYSNKKTDYCLNLGSTFNNAAYINIVILPHNNQTHFSTPTSSSYTRANFHEKKLCTEFYPHRTHENTIFNDLLHSHKLEPYQTQALGVSLFNMLEGHCSAFYKPYVKPWDIMAGAGILSTNKEWDISFIDKNNEAQNLFGNTPEFIQYLDSCYADNCRIGHLIITDKNQKTLQNAIISKLKNIPIP